MSAIKTTQCACPLFINMHNKIRLLICINKTNYKAVHIVLHHFDQKINLCIPEVPGRTVTELYRAWKSPLAGEMIMIFLRRLANKVKYEFPFSLASSSNPGKG